jgi:arabinose-5-phosphate isomerase
MTRTPLTIRRTARMGEAVALMRARKISELPVLDEDDRPVGLLDITDLIGADEAATHTPQGAAPAIPLHRASA